MGDTPRYVIELRLSGLPYGSMVMPTGMGSELTHHPLDCFDESPPFPGASPVPPASSAHQNLGVQLPSGILFTQRKRTIGYHSVAAHGVLYHLSTAAGALLPLAGATDDRMAYLQHRAASA